MGRGICVVADVNHLSPETSPCRCLYCKVDWSRLPQSLLGGTWQHGCSTGSWPTNLDSHSHWPATRPHVGILLGFGRGAWRLMDSLKCLYFKVNRSRLPQSLLGGTWQHGCSNVSWPPNHDSHSHWPATRPRVGILLGFGRGAWRLLYSLQCLYGKVDWSRLPQSLLGGTWRHNMSTCLGLPTFTTTPIGGNQAPCWHPLGLRDGWMGTDLLSNVSIR